MADGCDYGGKQTRKITMLFVVLRCFRYYNRVDAEGVARNIFCGEPCLDGFMARQQDLFSGFEGTDAPHGVAFGDPFRGGGVAGFEGFAVTGAAYVVIGGERAVAVVGHRGQLAPGAMARLRIMRPIALRRSNPRRGGESRSWPVTFQVASSWLAARNPVVAARSIRATGRSQRTQSPASTRCGMPVMTSGWSCHGEISASPQSSSMRYSSATIVMVWVSG